MTLTDLTESVTYFTMLAAEKLRQDGSVASSICLHIRTNPFNETAPQYQSSKVVPLGQPTDDTTKLVNAAIKGLKEIYRTGYYYKKSGVLLMALQPKETIQATLIR